MKRELIIINVILALTVIGATVELRTEWVGFETTHSPAGIQFDGEALSAPDEADRTVSPIQDWTAIAEQNLFSFDRNDLAIETSEGPVAAGPPPFLFGTMSLGEDPMAMLAIGEPGNREYRPVRIGEVFDGWELVEILDKSVRIRSGGVETTVIMNDPTAQMPRDQSRTIARSGAAPAVSTVQAPAAAAGVQSGVNQPTTRQSGTANRGAVTEDNVPPGFVIQRTPFGNRLVPKPQP